MTQAAEEPLVLAGPCPLCGRVEPAPRWARRVAAVIVVLIFATAAALMVGLVAWVWTHV